MICIKLLSAGIVFILLTHFLCFVAVRVLKFDDTECDETLNGSSRPGIETVKENLSLALATWIQLISSIATEVCVTDCILQCLL